MKIIKLYKKIYNRAMPVLVMYEVIAVKYTLVCRELFTQLNSSNVRQFCII